MKKIFDREKEKEKAHYEQKMSCSISICRIVSFSMDPPTICLTVVQYFARCQPLNNSFGNNLIQKFYLTLPEQIKIRMDWIVRREWGREKTEKGWQIHLVPLLLLPKIINCRCVHLYCTHAFHFPPHHRHGTTGKKERARKHTRRHKSIN